MSGFCRKKVCVIILNWNRTNLTINCLKSVMKSSYSCFEIVVVDNGSTDNFFAKITSWLDSINKKWQLVNDNSRFECDSSVKLVILKNNTGYSGGNNTGMRIAIKNNCEYIWLLNNDTIVKKDSMSALVECLEKGKRVGMVGSKLIYMYDEEALQCCGGGVYIPYIGNSHFYLSGDSVKNHLSNHNCSLDYICGASLMVKKEVIDNVGFLDESFFLYWEDVEWGIRTKSKGYELVYCPKSIVYHMEGGTAGRINRVNDYYWVRNGLYLTKKFYPQYLPLVLLSYLIKYTLIRALKGEKLNLKAFFRGVLDFLRGKKGRCPYEI